MDMAELEKGVEEAIASTEPENGDSLTDGEKVLAGLKARFQTLTRTFYAPEQAAQLRAKMDRLEKEKLKSAHGDRTGGGASAMGSVNGASNNDAAAKAEYTPLAPEQW